MIPIYEPLISSKEKSYVADCMRSGWISSQGDYISRFERGLCEYHDVSEAIVTSSCTTALHLALKTLCIGEGDEVICPDLTFIAPANMIVLSGATLRLVDVDPNTLALDPMEVTKSINSKTKAMIVVHQFGHAAPMDELMGIAKQHNLRVIEDNAESIGGRYKGKLLGTFGDLTCLSFFANKIMTTGEGGAVLTQDGNLADRCRILRDHGMSKETRYKHIDIGYNYRMTNLQAAIGLAQLENLEKVLKARLRQMKLYYNLLSTSNSFVMRHFADWCEPVHWLTTLTLKDKFNRNCVLDKMRDKGVDCRQMINPVHHAEHFKKQHNDEDFINAIKISKMSMHLPSSITLKDEDINFIVDKLFECLAEI
jgi:perosamine synthetase